VQAKVLLSLQGLSSPVNSVAQEMLSNVTSLMEDNIIDINTSESTQVHEIQVEHDVRNQRNSVSVDVATMDQPSSNIFSNGLTTPVPLNFASLDANEIKDIDNNNSTSLFTKTEIAVETEDSILEQVESEAMWLEEEWAILLVVCSQVTESRVYKQSFILSFLN